MRNWWIRFGCFLTGHNYGIVMNSSEATAKSVKRYTAALLIVCLLWAFIGYTFTERYLHGGIVGSAGGALVMMVIVVQIERQIILTVHANAKLYWARAIIAGMMALIGSVIIDQTIFKQDIELEQITRLESRIKDALPPRMEELRSQIAGLNADIHTKEKEHLALVDDLNQHPTIKNTTLEKKPMPRQSIKRDPATGESISVQVIEDRTSVTVIDVPNPKQAQLAPLEHAIAALRAQKVEKEKALLNIRPQVEKEIKSHVGFMDELDAVMDIMMRSPVAMIVWLIWFLFLMGLELLVLIGKSADKGNDYDKTIRHQMELQMRRLDGLAKLGQG